MDVFVLLEHDGRIAAGVRDRIRKNPTIDFLETIVWTGISAVTHHQVEGSFTEIGKRFIQQVEHARLTSKRLPDACIQLAPVLQAERSITNTPRDRSLGDPRRLRLDFHQRLIVEILDQLEVSGIAAFIRVMLGSKLAILRLEVVC
jgi:hypothetical protein